MDRYLPCAKEGVWDHIEMNRQAVRDAVRFVMSNENVKALEGLIKITEKSTIRIQS